MKYPQSSPAAIRVSSNSEVAKWAKALSRNRTKPLDAVEVDGRPSGLFVADQLIVDHKDKDLLAELVERYGGKIVPRLAIPAPPDGLEGRDPAVTAAMPLPILVNVSQAPSVSARAGELLRTAFAPTVSVTSEASGRLLGLAAELIADGRRVGLNPVASASTLSLSDPIESNPQRPLAAGAFIGRSRVGAAWQLVETFRQFHSTKPVTVGILDAGFWLNGFTPNVPKGQIASDLGSAVAQLNLLDESVGAGGASGIPTSTGFDFPWHGNASASVATARVGNALGAAGVGGTVAVPVLFKTDASTDQFLTCLSVCLRWGVDILNISLEITKSGLAEFFFPESVWKDNFQFASDHGLIIVVSAGNSGTRIPEDSNPRPATRTPGTITVGALDSNDQAQPYSNYGSSINVWAPTDIFVIPDNDQPNGQTFGGTSASAPFVSGILAMMRAVAPINTLDAGRAKQLLEQSGWRGTGKVGIGVDAYAAVLAAMGGRLPDNEAEAHATPQTARRLKAGPGGLLMPFRLRSSPLLDVLSSATHSNWYSFAVSTFSQINVVLSFYPLMGGVSVTLEPDDPNSRALPELVTTTSAGKIQLSGLVSPGGYKLFVRGSLNLYELSVQVKEVELPPDGFENNDTFETCTPFFLLEPGAVPAEILPPRAQMAGTYDLSLHKSTDQDFFLINPEVSNPLSEPVVTISLSDLPVDVTIFDKKRNVVENRVGVRSTKIPLPRTEISFVRVSGKSPTRYRLTARLEIDQSHLPGPNQPGPGIPLPDLGDPAFHIDKEVQHLVFQLDKARATVGTLALAATEGEPMKVELLNQHGHVVRAAVSREDTINRAAHISFDGLELGTYVLRVGHADSRLSLATSPLNVKVVPSFL